VTDDERCEILEALRRSIAEAEAMTPEQARQRLVDAGYLDIYGSLRPEYGGPLTAAPNTQSQLPAQ
jgi:hypothetical protein